jgi:hypothetical protein
MSPVTMEIGVVKNFVEQSHLHWKLIMSEVKTSKALSDDYKVQLGDKPCS